MSLLFILYPVSRVAPAFLIMCSLQDQSHYYVHALTVCKLEAMLHYILHHLLVYIVCESTLMQPVHNKLRGEHSYTQVFLMIFQGHACLILERVAFMNILNQHELKIRLGLLGYYGFKRF